MNAINFQKINSLWNLIPASKFDIVFSEDEKNVIKSYFSLKKIKKGDFFLQENEESLQLGIIQRGVFRTFQKIDQVEKVKRIESEGAFLTDLYSLLSGKPSIENIQALEDSEVWVIEKADMCTLYDKFKNFERLGRRYFEKLYMQEHQRNFAFHTEDAATRYEKFRTKYPQIVDRVPQNYIASYLGITPQSLSRLRGQKKIL
jgi:CRP-like cAMP-binding protein